MHAGGAPCTVEERRHWLFCVAADKMALMQEPVDIIPVAGWHDAFDEQFARGAQRAAEAGRVLLFPQLTFALTEDERRFLTPACADGKSKNISLDPASGRIQGATLAGPDLAALAAMMQRFAREAQSLVVRLFGSYSGHIEPGRTSFRPVEVEGRTSSYRKDDTRLHVDAFASRPNHGRRILRLFSNINPQGRARVWHVGEPFEDFAARFCPRVGIPLPGAAWLLERLGITRGRRSLYDHVMLGLHDRSKGDLRYQRDADKARIEFPAGSTWIVFTDRVLHAALNGQYVLEQTFYLPVAAMQEPHHAPLAILEKLMQRPLV